MQAKIQKSVIGYLVILIPDMKTMHIAVTEQEAIDWCIENDVLILTKHGLLNATSFNEKIIETMDKAFGPHIKITIPSGKHSQRPLDH